MEINLKNIFLIYANHSLKENPEIFFDIFDEYKKLIIEPEDLEIFDNYKKRTIPYFVKFVKFDNYKKALAFYEKESSKIIANKLNFFEGKEYLPQTNERDQFAEELIIDMALNDVKEAFYAVYGNKRCQDSGPPCNFLIKAIYALDAKLLNGSNKLACYECYQLYFRKMLEGIIEGREYSEIPKKFENQEYPFPGFLKPDLANFLIGAPQPSRVIEISKTSALDSEFTEMIITSETLNIGERPLKGDIWSLFNSFILFEIVAYSLSEWLLNNDRRKLKYCQACEKFYIQTKLNPKQKFCPRCSPKSKMSKEKRREYQRKYRQKKKQQERAIQREARIEYLMKRVECSREEAIGYIEADESMM